MPFVAVDGYKLHYAHAGSGPPLLFITGLLGSGEEDFSKQLSDLSDSYLVVAPDLRGYGRSRPPERSYPQDYLQRDARDVLGILDQLDIREAAIGGWSDGSAVAIAIATLRPQMVRSLVLWGGNAVLLPSDIDVLQSMKDPQAWPPRMRIRMLKRYGDAVYGVWSSYLECMDRIREGGGDICASQLPYVTCRTLVCECEKDLFVHRDHADIFASGINGARRLLFKDGTHDIHIRKSKEFNEAVRKFLEE